MPNRYDTRGFGSERGPRQGDRAPERREGRSFDTPDYDTHFRAEDARLNAALDRYERDRPHFGPEEYGHDENYRPGYHQGGTRFGFFGGPNGSSVGAAPQPFRSLDEQDFDPDYLSWRQSQLSKHDRDYGDWRREQMRRYDDDYWKFRSERREDFHQRFQDWLAQRDAEKTAPMAKGGKPDKA